MSHAAEDPLSRLFLLASVEYYFLLPSRCAAHDNKLACEEVNVPRTSMFRLAAIVEAPPAAGNPSVAVLLGVVCAHIYAQ